MPTLPSLLVTDTNIWIDLHHAGLVQVVFRLPYRILASDFVLASELRQPTLDVLRELGLELVPLGPPQVAEILALRRQHGRLSVQDLAAFLVAREQKAVLLTGDRRLAELGAAQGLTVHGVLWLLDELVAQTSLTPVAAASALTTMLRHGARLPEEECRKRLSLWAN